MQVTEKWLVKQRACSGGLDWFLGQQETDLKTVLLKLIDEMKPDWCFWVLTRKLNLKQKKQLAVFSAREVLPIFEKKYPDDKRPRLAIEAAEKVIKNNTKKNRDAAYDAAYAADAAASTVYVDAAYAAAYAADAAASAADAAAHAVYVDAVTAAAYTADADVDAARKALRVKIVGYGLELLGESCK